MPCNNNCNCCNNKLITTAVAITGTAPNQILEFTVPTQTFTNLSRTCLIIAQPLPAGSNTLPIQINAGGTPIPVYTRTGNVLRADQISCRKRYSVIYGNDPEHFSLQCYVGNTCFTEPPATPSVT